MKWIMLTGLLLTCSALADREFEPPEVRCLNDQTIPFIPGKIPAKTLVDRAFLHCQAEIDAWKQQRSHLPPALQERQYQEFYDFYIRMIEIRRGVLQRKAEQAAH